MILSLNLLFVVLFQSRYSRFVSCSFACNHLFNRQQGALTAHLVFCWRRELGTRPNALRSLTALFHIIISLLSLSPASLLFGFELVLLGLLAFILGFNVTLRRSNT